MSKAASEIETKDVAKKQKSTTHLKRAAASRSVRKAPTSISKKQSNMPSIKLIAAICLSVITIAGVSAFIGMSDTGPIDVKSTIAQRASVQEAKGNMEESEAIRAIGENQVKANDLPNGGLVGAGNKETRQQKQEAAARAAVAPSTSSTTASSTEEADSAAGEENATESEDTNTNDTLEVGTENLDSDVEAVIEESDA